MQDKKYQIFVSSTYEDLKEERDQVVKAILSMGHIPIGMEMFSAGDEQQWEIIKSHIDKSDYYLIICANRYGSTTSDGISYTEKEYDYAASIGVPIIGFLLDESAAWPTSRNERNTQNLERLNAFKTKIKNKPVGFWSTKDDLYGKCAIALPQQINRIPRQGWVRHEMDATEVANQIARLSAENAKLLEENNILREQYSSTTSSRSFKFQKIIEGMRRSMITLNIIAVTDQLPTENNHISLLDFFKFYSSKSYLAEEIKNFSENYFYDLLALFKYEKTGIQLDGRVMAAGLLSSHSFEKLETAGLVDMLNRTENRYKQRWTVTDLGYEVLQYLEANSI